MDSKYNYNLGLKFYDIVDKNPDKIVIKYPDNKSYSYLELNQISDSYANYFITNHNIKKGDVVCICNDKSINAFAAMIACLKVGVIYTNIDFNSPVSRLEKILKRCNPKLILIDINIEFSFSNQRFNYINLEDIPSTSDNTLNIKEFSKSVTGSNPAYIMFTSGSTGFPKGAVITHQNLLNFINWGKDEYSVSNDDIFTNVNPIYFDNSVFDFYVSIFNNACLVPFNNEQVKNTFELVKSVDECGCTSWFSVPSLLIYLLTTKAITNESFKYLKRIIFGGEGFPKPKLKILFNYFGKRINLYNVYGPTECTCICSSYLISEKDFQNLDELAPLGKLSPNFDYIILNSENNIGELCLTGPNVGSGYYNDKERTNSSFMQSPDNKNYNEIIYKTGDLVEIKNDGYLYFRGRADNQIKHMGYRIELEEIEFAINTISQVKEVCVIYKRINDLGGEIRAIVAVNSNISDKEILNNIKSKLPDYMIPKKIIVVDSLPKNQNGKIDRVIIKEKYQ